MFFSIPALCILILVPKMGLSFEENKDLRFKPICGQALKDLALHLCGPDNVWDGEEAKENGIQPMDDNHKCCKQECIPDEMMKQCKLDWYDYKSIWKPEEPAKEKEDL